METIKHMMIKAATDGVASKSRQAYKDHVADFADWLKNAHGLKSPRQLDGYDRVMLINAYVGKLVNKGLSPSSIHTYIAPVCKGLGVKMQDVTKPKRTAASITKSRDLGQNDRGYKAAHDPAAARLVMAQKAIGIRRSELLKLRGRDLQTDINGQLCVYVKSGKGGKDQYQIILPADQQMVKNLFAGKDPGELIFTNDEIRASKNIDLHAMRAEHARDAYKEYEQIVASGGSQCLKKALINSFKAYHAGDPQSAKYMAQMARFMGEMEGVYRLRGDNRQRAVALGRPVEYNKLAVLCVSVWHLSHWRNDVTIKHYFV